MSAVRLLARNIARSEWGKARGLGSILTDNNQINMFARAIIIPKRFLDESQSSGFNPQTLSDRFEVPEEDTLLRLQDLNLA
jgi:predicted transcriptional regulator